MTTGSGQNCRNKNDWDQTKTTAKNGGKFQGQKSFRVNMKFWGWIGVSQKMKFWNPLEGNLGHIEVISLRNLPSSTLSDPHFRQKCGKVWQIISCHGEPILPFFDDLDLWSRSIRFFFRRNFSLSDFAHFYKILKIEKSDFFSKTVSIQKYEI